MGEWKTFPQSGNNVLAQDQEQSCGYCCIGMVVNHLDPTFFPSEESLVAAGKREGSGEYDKAPVDIIGAQQTFLVQAAYEEFGHLPYWGTGTYGKHLADILTNQYQINATYQANQSDTNRKRAMRAVTAGHPMIVLVQWDGGGGHWVLVVGRATRGWGKASDYTILDPSGDVVINRGSTNYTAANGSKGKFAGYYVTVEGKIAQAQLPRVKVMI
ncbi:MAG: hypothetical protein R3240_04425 [Gammaproteobacteria bacterium]|nr:hypothetical protein [Gammaproteobacteria bacterium]